MGFFGPDDGRMQENVGERSEQHLRTEACADVEHLLPFLDGVVHRHRVQPGGTRAADEHIDAAQRRLRRGGDRFLREATVALGASGILPREKPRAKKQHLGDAQKLMTRLGEGHGL